jgi:hypothetical protein
MEAAQRPRSAPPPGASGSRLSLGDLSNNVTVGQKGTSKPASQWTCAACGTALGPQSVMKGTGIIIDGSLMCVDCVKSGGPKARKGPAVSVTSILLFGSCLAAVLGVAAIFLPSQVLLIVLLLSTAGLLIGLIGFTLRGVTRLGIIAGSLCIMILSTWGMLVVGQNAEDRATRAEVAAQTEQIKALLEKNCIYEAEMRILAIEQGYMKLNSGHPKAAAETALTDLRNLTDEWLRKNIGPLSAAERALLFDIYHQVHSLTAKSQSRRIRAFKINNDTNVSLTLAADPVERGAFESRDKAIKSSTINGTDDPIEADADQVFIFFLKRYAPVQNVELKIISAEDDKELFNKSLDLKGLMELREKMSPSPRKSGERPGPQRNPMEGRPKVPVK